MRSENINEIASALVAVQSAIKGAVKGKENPGFKGSRYADLPAVVDACKAELTANKIAYSQVPNFEGETTYLETILMHASGQWISGRYPLRPTKQDPQGMGSALTYARRYSLASMVGVVAEDEDDDGNAASVPVVQYAPEGATTLPKPDKKAGANAWGKSALDKIEKMTTAEFDAWHGEKLNRNGVATVREYNEALHKRLTDAIRAKQNSQPIAAE